MDRWTIATVAFEGDLGLSLLQARSLSLYADPLLVEEVVVVDNFGAGAKPPWFEEAWARRAAPLPVRFLAADSVAPCHGAVAPHPWMRQQAIKLAVSASVVTERYLVVDAKTHLVRPLLPSFLESPDGRMRTNGYPYGGHPLWPYLERARRYLGLPAPNPKAPYIRTSTPFAMSTSVAGQVVELVEGRQRMGLSEAMARLDLTEFFLYAAYLEERGGLGLYDWGQPWCADLWKEDASHAAVAAALAKAMRPESGPFLSTHRGALARMGPAGSEALAAFWGARGLRGRSADAHGLLPSLGWA